MTDFQQVPPPTPPEMGLDEIAAQCLLDSIRWWPNHRNDTEYIPFLTLAWFGEVGEAANIVKKIWRGSYNLKEAKSDLQEEIVDAFTYMMNLVGILNFDLYEEYLKKRAFNEERWGPAARAAEEKMRKQMGDDNGA